MTTDHVIGVIGVIAIAVGAGGVIYQLNRKTGKGTVIGSITNIGGSALSDLYKSTTSKG